MPKNFYPNGEDFGQYIQKKYGGPDEAPSESGQIVTGKILDS